MENQNYNDLLMKAARQELTANDLNDVVLLIDKKLNDKELKDNERDKKLSRHDRQLKDMEEEYPLLPPEADDLATAVKKKGVEVLGGKKTCAYLNKDLRKRVYMDIYAEIKRQYGLISATGKQLSYKKLRRKYLQGAFVVVDQYEAPIAIANEIEAENELGDDDV